MYARGTMVDLGTFPGGIQAAASAINDVGQVVGTSDGAIAVSKKTTEHFSHAFLYANGKMVDLGIPSGATYSQGTAINRNGQIVGSAGFSDGSHAVVYSNGVWTDLGKFPGSSTTEATGINLSGKACAACSTWCRRMRRAPKRVRGLPRWFRNTVSASCVLRLAVLSRCCFSS
jgi:probable HAF family extracellular repeat protein